MSSVNGKYVRVKLTGKYGIVNYTTTLSGMNYYWIVLNNFSTTVATLDELDIIY